MQYDLFKTPFSYFGSYMTISYFPFGGNDANGREGLYIRTMHMDRAAAECYRIEPTVNGQPAEYTYTAEPHKLTIACSQGAIEVCFAEPEILLFRGRGSDSFGMRLVHTGKTGFAYAHPLNKNGTYMLVNYPCRTRFAVCAKHGSVRPVQKWNTDHSDELYVDFVPENGLFLAAVEQVKIEWAPKSYDYDFDTCAEKAQKAFSDFLTVLPALPAEWSHEREYAGYITWMCAVAPFGIYKRPGILMSKNWMSRIWSWDHCFNAMALASADPELAWDQLMIMFDYQDASGAIPDSITDFSFLYTFCKPPIHGWALSRMLKQMDPGQEKLADAYDKLSKWTHWWLNYRDTDGDGLCEYFHGNDSGWDNGTIFDRLPPVATPDLAAFLIYQMDVLAELAEKLGRHADACGWTEKADRMTSVLEEKLLSGENPVALYVSTGEKVTSRSLLLYMPLLIGPRLSESTRGMLLRGLKEGGFLTEYGLATESTQSPLFNPQGYWRGPVWAPTTMLIVDGLKACGETEPAAEIVRRFARLVRKSGFAENYDPITGDCLCDKSYTWTTGAFLALGAEYLTE